MNEYKVRPEQFLSHAKIPLHLAFAIPDDPWIDSADGAAVRIAMTVAAPGKSDGVLENIHRRATGGTRGMRCDIRRIA